MEQHLRYATFYKLTYLAGHGTEFLKVLGRGFRVALTRNIFQVAITDSGLTFGMAPRLPEATSSSTLLCLSLLHYWPILQCV